nr:YfiR family protein [Rhizobacter sp. SG703]
MACAAACAWVPAARADDAEQKATLVFNLLLFIDWPTDVLPPQAPSLALCIDRASPLRPAVQALDGRIVRHWRLDVRDLASAGSWSACHAVLLDSPSNAPERPPVGTLLIADGDAAPSVQAAVVLHRTGERVVFDIDLATVRQSRLQVSSKLLRVAHRVSE